MVKVEVIGIKWDTFIEVVEEGEVPYHQSRESLPTKEPELYLDVYLEETWTEKEKDDAVAEVIMDYLSEEYGYLVSSFVWGYL
jgi:hypothetical protein